MPPLQNAATEEAVEMQAGAAANGDILSVDIGGTLIKAAVIDSDGSMLCPWVRVPTPAVATPDAIIAHLRELAKPMPEFQRISIAFPGVVRHGRTLTAPNLGNEHWQDFAFACALEAAFHRDVRILNDAVVQGLGVATGPGIECILTLGTGLGFALFNDSRFLVQLELGRHFARDGLNYDAYVGHTAYIEAGDEIWNSRVRTTFDAVRNLVHFDHLFIGGGNNRRITFSLEPDCSIIPMTAGITGGARLWHADADAIFQPSSRREASA